MNASVWNGGWICSFIVGLLLLACGLVSVNASGQATIAKLPRVRLDGNYFSRDGHRFIPVGAHWVPAKAGMQWPVQWDPKDIEADFAKMHELGYNIVRFDVMWAWVEPRPGDYNPEAFKQIDYLVSLAHKYQIYLHPSCSLAEKLAKPIGMCRGVTDAIRMLTPRCCDWKRITLKSLAGVMRMKQESSGGI